MSGKHMAFMHNIMHWADTVDRCGYDGQQKGTICDAHGPYPSIWSTLKSVFRQVRLIHCAYESLRCLDLEEVPFFVLTTQCHNRLLYPLVQVQGVIKEHSVIPVLVLPSLAAIFDFPTDTCIYSSGKKMLPFVPFACLQNGAWTDCKRK